jgi:PAS domain S-box-containing protein
MELIENKDLFQAVFDSAANGIAVLQAIYDDKGKVEDFSILLLNKYILNWTGDTDYKNKRYGDVFPLVKKTGTLEKFIRVAETGITANFEQWYHGEKNNYWFRFTAVKQSEVIIITVEDITEWKQTEMALNEALDKAEKQERLYNSITNNTPDLVYVFGLDYRFTYANKALLDMWGKSAEDAIGQGLRENGYGEWHAQLHEREIDAIIATKKSIRGTVSFPHAELGSRIYDYILVPVLNGKGEVEAIAGTTRDITDIKRVEENLQQSEARFRNVLQEAPVAATLFRGPDLIIEIANELTQQYWAKSEDMIGKPIAEAAPELEDQQMIALLKDIYQRGGTANFSEVPITFTKDGILKEGYYSFSVKALYDASGNVDRILSIGIDVTEQVTARKKLEESESRFRALVNASSDVLYSMNADWTEMQRLEGRGFLSDTREPIPNWIEKYIHPDDYEIVKKAVVAAIAGKSIFELEHRLIQENGTLGWTFSRAIPIFDNKGDIFEWFGTASDVTERKKAEHALKRSEEDLSNLVLQSPIGICVMDAATLVNEIVNDKFVEIAGKPYEAIMGKWYWDTFAEVAPYYETALQEVVDKGEPFYVNEAELKLIRHGKEEIVYVTFVYEPMKDSTGLVKKIVVWVLENTLQVNARRRVEESENRYKLLSETLEQQVKVRTKELQRSNEDLQQFAHVASHDLKEPVRKIRTFAGRLEEQLNGKLDELSTRFIEKIHVSAERMSTMIEGVLAYSTINAGKQKPELVDLNEILKNIEIDLEIPLQKTGGKIQYGNLPLVEGAPVLLYQLFYNLINNSIKFARTGVSPQITISPDTDIQNNKNLSCITVQDNGIGFDPDLAGRIFETFTRLNSKDKYEGTGLGLSLCKKIVERHGGTIIANSTKGEGATFIITLPLQQKGTGI